MAKNSQSPNLCFFRILLEFKVTLVGLSLFALLAVLLHPASVLAQTIPPRPTTSALSDPLAPPKPEPLRVAHDVNYWPFSYKEKNEYTGFDMELWLNIAGNLEQEYILKPMNFQDIIPALEAGKIDIAIAAIPVTQSRNERVQFTVPYFRSGLRVLCHKGKEIKNIEELANKRVALERNSLAEDFVKEGLKTKSLRYCSYHDEMFFELLAGNVDVVLAEYSLLRAYLALTQNPDLVIAEPWIKPYNIAIALPKNSPHHKTLNKALQTFKGSEEYKALCLKWFGEVPNLSAK